MKHHLLIVFLFIGSVATLFSVPLHAQTPTNKGLFISPPRNFVEVDAGKTSSSEVTITNLTESPLEVTMLIEEFTVSDYSYEYIFSQPKENWINFTETLVQLQPGENKKVPYTVTPPLGSTPGGKYYTIIAQATIVNGGVSSRVQVAAPLYITVNGQTTRTSELTNHHINRFTFTAGTIPFTLDIKNTGNTHYIATAKGSLSGLFTDKSTVTDTHILLPGTIRQVKESIPAPLLPGIYRATYGYETDSGGAKLISSYIVYAPLWFYVALFFSGWGVYRFLQYRKNSKSTDSQPQPYTSPK